MQLGKDLCHINWQHLKTMNPLKLDGPGTSKKLPSTSTGSNSVHQLIHPLVQLPFLGTPPPLKNHMFLGELPLFVDSHLGKSCSMRNVEVGAAKWCDWCLMVSKMASGYTCCFKRFLSVPNVVGLIVVFVLR